MEGYQILSVQWHSIIGDDVMTCCPTLKAPKYLNDSCGASHRLLVLENLTHIHDLYFVFVFFFP